MKKTLMIILSMGFMAFATSAQAASAAGTVAVSATAVNSCVATSSSPTAFGNFSGAQIDLTTAAAGSVGYQCTVATPVSIALDAGANYAAGTRRMTDGAGNFLTYELYQGNALANLFGDAGVTHPGGVRNFTTVSMNSALPARMFAAASYVPGSYSDTVNITVTY